MFDLTTQQDFETMWFHTGSTVLSGTRSQDHAWIVYYTASWCSACKHLDMEKLDEVAKQRGLTIWKCDDSVNDYTAGYCNVRAFPTFHFCTPRKIVKSIQSNKTDIVAEWIAGL